MELRKTEEEVRELLGSYESIRQSPLWKDEDLDYGGLPQYKPLTEVRIIAVTVVTTSDIVDGQEEDENAPSSTTVVNEEQDVQTTTTTSIVFDTTTETEEENDGSRDETKEDTDPPSKKKKVTTKTTTITTQTLSTQTLVEDALLVASKSSKVPGDLVTLVSVAQKIQSSLQGSPNALEQKSSRFRQRLGDTDPITGKPRYGAKTQGRVQALLHAYDFLRENVGLSSVATDKAGVWVHVQRLINGFKQRQQDQAKAEEEAAFRRQQEAREAERQALQAQQEAKRKAEEEAERQRAEAQAVEEELRRQAQEARERRIAQEQAEREWIEGLVAEGVAAQVDILVQSTSEDLDAQVQAFTSLVTIFRQINARPEEVNFRRIRKDHEQFQKDIGRHPGGIEILIAAGFRPGAIDEVPCYISKEPNIEKDMDGWSAWFDLLKQTLEILLKAEEDSLERLMMASTK